MRGERYNELQTHNIIVYFIINFLNLISLEHPLSAPFPSPRPPYPPPDPQTIPPPSHLQPIICQHGHKRHKGSDNQTKYRGLISRVSSSFSGASKTTSTFYAKVFELHLKPAYS